MNEITLLRSKGLTDDEIMLIISQKHAAALVDAYVKGYREGQKRVMALIENFTALARFATQSDAELAS